MLNLERERPTEPVALSPLGSIQQRTTARSRLDRVFESLARSLRLNPWSYIVAGVAVVAVVVTNQIDLGADQLRVGLLNANSRFSWSHDVDTLALALGMAAAVRGARRGGRDSQLWWATAVILGLFFLDEASPLHTAIDHLPLGKALYSPILLALVTCVWLLAAHSDQQVVVAAGLVTLCASFAMHVVGLHALHPIGYLSGPYQAGVGVKEGTELAGLTLVVLALWRLAKRGPANPDVPAARQ